MGIKVRMRTLQNILKEIRLMEKKEGMKRYGEPFLDCDEVAEMAKTIMQKKGIIAKVVVGSVKGQSHAWVETNEMIVDPTASQFKLPHLIKIKKAKLYRR